MMIIIIIKCIRMDCLYSHGSMDFNQKKKKTKRNKTKKTYHFHDAMKNNYFGNISFELYLVDILVVVVVTLTQTHTQRKQS